MKTGGRKETATPGSVERYGNVESPAKASGLGDHSIASRHRRLTHLILPILVALILIYGVIYPNLRVLMDALQVNGEWSLANFSALLSQRVLLKAVLTSIGLSLLTVLFCALVGVSLAFLFER